MSERDTHPSRSQRGTYREATHPPPVVFPLDMTTPMRGAFLLIISILLTLVAAAASGFVVWFVAAGMVPALGFVLRGAPRRVGVHHDQVELQYWLRRKRTFAASELMLQRMPSEMLLVTSEVTVDLPLHMFAGPAAFDQCADAISAVANEVIRHDTDSA